MANFTVWERFKRNKTGAAAPADILMLPSVNVTWGWELSPVLNKREND